MNEEGIKSEDAVEEALNAVVADDEDVEGVVIAEDSDEAFEEAAEESDAVTAGAEWAEEAKDAVPTKKKLNRWYIALGVITAVLVVAFGGFMYWHEQPSFCGAFCHTPMDSYLATYNYEHGEPAVDKWGNEVSDSNAMMAVTHKAQGADCLDCHVPTIKEQLYEGMKWITGNYANPLRERTLSDLVKARGIPNDEFCLNSGCHHVDADGAPLETREDLVISSAYLKRPVHTPQHAVFKCSACHKAHRASVIYCSKCHDDAEFPAGWRPYGTIEQTTSTPRCADVPDLCN